MVPLVGIGGGWKYLPSIMGDKKSNKIVICYDV
jgi:hypothetical protein